MQQLRPTFAQVDLRHLRGNLRYLRSLIEPDLFFCPMVKAQAYGHGDVEVARVLESEKITSIGVALCEEGIRLREHGIKADVLVFGPMNAKAAEAGLEKKLTPVLGSWAHVEALQSVAPKFGKIPVHVKFDTGMIRWGFETKDTAALVDFFEKNPQFELKGVATHLHSAEDMPNQDGLSRQQLITIQKIGEAFSKWTRNVHSLNSGGILQHKDSKHLQHGARPGAALYGIPAYSGAGDLTQIKSVMNFRTHIVRVKKIEAGQGVSYSHRWTSKKPSWIGVLPVGYGDGYPRILSNQSEALLMGKRVPIVGTVCMDYVMIDMTELVGSGDGGEFLWKEVTLFGYDSTGQFLAPQSLAEKAGTIAYEILTRIGARVPRTYVDG